MQCKIDGVHRLSAKSRVHHQRRERRTDRIPGHTINLGRSIHLVHPVCLEQRACRDLARRRLFSRRRRREREGRTGPQSKNARDDSSLTHADAHNAGVVAVFHLFQEAHQCQVVGERLGGGHNLHELRRKRVDPRKDRIKPVGRFKIMVADDQRGAGSPNFCERRSGKFLSRFQFDIDQLEARFRRLQ